MADKSPAMNREMLVEVMHLAQREFEAIHGMLDRLEIQTHHDGEKLSAGQRVGILVGAFEATVKGIGRTLQ